jgi:HAMP domain-containing protein
VKRLYVQIFLTVVAALLAFALLAGLTWRLFGEPHCTANAREAVSEMIYAALPPADAPREAHQAALNRIAGSLQHDIALYGADGTPLARLGRDLPPPEWAGTTRGRQGRRGPAAWSLQLPDGRWLVVRFHRGPRPPIVGLVVTLALLALGVAVGAYPVVRRLTRRLERLKVGVDALGAGDLAARVPVEGSDEVAALAETFNRAAGRIEALVTAHKKLLANASHELRSPLARIRMAIGMHVDGGDPRLRAEVERDIAELDALETGERERGGKAKALVDDLPLFSAAVTQAPPPATPAPPSAVEVRLREVHPDELTPREALALAYELRALLRD